MLAFAVFFGKNGVAQKADGHAQEVLDFIKTLN